MKDSLKIKKKLYEACLHFTNEKLTTVMNMMHSNKKALFSETKSSAGDKHETGRAMIQLEMEKLSGQLGEINLMDDVLKKMDYKKKSEVICLGSLIITDKTNYYLAISAGKIVINSVEFFAISTNSPIGQQILGKKTRDKIPFNNVTILEFY
ncbi:MAG: 3-oxoacyl-ACP synthase [Lutibacter sp.]|nr:MAG: 3-oxoacyl-ACP synthase [Lutibacter sp.]